MGKKLDINPGTREFHQQNQALTYDTDGNETFCGLNIIESEEYVAMSEVTDQRVRLQTLDRNVELSAKHEAARRSFLSHEIDSRTGEETA